MLTDQQILEINASIDNVLQRPVIDRVEITLGVILTILQDKFGVTDEDFSKAETKWVKIVEDSAKPAEQECDTCEGKGWWDMSAGGEGPAAYTQHKCEDCGGAGIAQN